MNFPRLSGHALAAVLGAAWLSACDLDVPDLNNPGLDTLQNNPDDTTKTTNSMTITKAPAVDGSAL